MTLEALDLAKQEILDNPQKRDEFWDTWSQIVIQLPEDDLRQLNMAIHEAGHAVMCWLVEYPFGHVTIIPREEEDSLGRILDAPFPEHIAKDIETGPCKVSEFYMDRRMIISLAGLAAESLHLEPHTPDSEQSMGDFNSALNYSTYRFSDGSGLQEYVNDMLVAAKDSLLHFYLHVVVLAIELVQYQILYYDKVISLLSKVPIQ